MYPTGKAVRDQYDGSTKNFTVYYTIIRTQNVYNLTEKTVSRTHQLYHFAEFLIAGNYFESHSLK